MLKYLAVFSAGALLWAGIMSGQPNQSSSSERDTAGQRQAGVVSANSQDKQADCNTDQAGSERNSPSRNAAFQRPAWMGDSNWWLVGIAVITAGVICWQSWETRKAGGAALDQIDLILRKERARLSVRPMEVDKVRCYTTPFDIFNVEIENYGPTHALEVTVVGGGIVTDSKNVPSLKDVTAQNAPDVIKSDAVIREVELTDWTEDKILWDAAERKIAKIFIHVRGRIDYRDVLGRKHWNTFCYIKEVFSIGPPDAERAEMKIFGLKWAKNGSPEDNDGDP